MPKSSSFWAQQRVLVTGGGGFLGSHVVDEIRKRGCTTLAAPRSRDFDLRQAADIQRLLCTVQPTLIVHLAALCGGIGANEKNSGSFFYDNAVMGIQLMEHARQHDVKKFVQVGTVCSYPKFPPRIPFKEDDLWHGYPEETNAPYGLAKKMLLVQAQAYRQQYGFNAIYLLPANLYGPRDHFDLENSHVIPALIRKIAQAQAKGADRVELWGTGKPTREFLHVQDAVRGILMAAERYNDAAPVNLGSGKPVSIRQLAETIARLMKYRGRFVWNSKRPDGQPRRSLDTTRARKAFAFRAEVSLKDGLNETIQWYLTHRDASGDALYIAPATVPSPTKETLKHPQTGEVMAVVIRGGFKGKKHNFFTPNEYPLQMGINSYTAGEKIKPHIHPPVTRSILGTPECLVIRKGHVRMHLFDAERRPALVCELMEGDIALLVSGGHGFEILRHTEIFEVKQGPYLGDADKTLFDFNSAHA